MSAYLSSPDTLQLGYGSVSILFEDEEIKVLWHPGESEFLIVTFGDLVTLANKDRFFADAPVKKLALNCIGFMAKRPNWFPNASVAKALDAISHITSKFETVVNYGGSMGGYAALKYSCRLRASSVIAFCPQWTIDKKECSGENPGYQKYFDTYMNDMSITKHDVSGNAFIFYDPSHKIDLFHATRILELSDSIHPILMRSTDHHVTTVMAGTSHLYDLIKHAKDDEVYQLGCVANNVRRAHQIRIRTLILKLSLRHPRLLENILQSPKVQLTDSDRDIVNARLLSAFLRLQDEERASTVIDRILIQEICPVRKQLLISAKTKIDIMRCRRVLTCHGTAVRYCIASGKLIHKKETDTLAFFDGTLPVFLIPIKGVSAIGIVVDGELHYVMLTENGTTSLVSQFLAERCESQIIRSDGADLQLKLKRGNKYVSAEIGGGIAYNRSVAKEWEHFSALLR